MTDRVAPVESRPTLPTRLRKEPLLEAVWEIRFEPSQPSGGELLSGLIFSELRTVLGLTNVQPLPIGTMPPELRDADPNLRYQATTRLDGTGYVVSVGRRVLALSSIRPYVGWTVFHERIRQLVEIAERSDIITRAERFSLKYVDVIPADVASPTLDALRVGIEVGRHRVDRQPTLLRTEIRDDVALHVLTVASPVEYWSSERRKESGIAIDVDSIVELGVDANLGSEVRMRIDQVHDANKRVFFDLLTDETLRHLEPEY